MRTSVSFYVNAVSARRLIFCIILRIITLFHCELDLVVPALVLLFDLFLLLFLLLKFLLFVLLFQGTVPLHFLLLLSALRELEKLVR